MFGFLKDKLKSALNVFTKQAKEHSKTEEKEVLVEKKPEKKIEKVPERKAEKPAEKKPEKIVEKKAEKAPEKKQERPVEKKQEKKTVPVPEKVSEKNAEKPAEKKAAPVPEKKPEKAPEKRTEKPAGKPVSVPLQKKGELKREFPKKEEKKEEPRKEEHKIGFFSKLFGKKQDDARELTALEAEESAEKIEQIREHIHEKEEKVAERIFEEEARDEAEDTAAETIEKEEGFDPDTRSKPVEEFTETKTPEESEEEQEIEQEETAEEIKEEDGEEENSEEEKDGRAEKEKEEDEEGTGEIPEKKGFFTRIKETFTTVQVSDSRFEEMFWDLEVAMLENNVAVEVIEKIKGDMKDELTKGRVARGRIEDIVLSRLKRSIEELFDVETFDLVERIGQKRAGSKEPYIIAMIGVNGSGKTTSLAKLVHLLKKRGLSVVLAAADTFRAAAIQQLEEHATRLDVTVIKHDYHSDPAAVAFDAIAHARAKNADVVIIDTAGRLHSNTNLMRELEKLIRVNKPDLKIFVGESITGNDCVEQARTYNDLVGIDAIILAKADIDEKGGAAVSVSFITKKPILYLGTGQTYDDLKPFKKEEILENLGLA